MSNSQLSFRDSDVVPSKSKSIILTPMQSTGVVILQNRDLDGDITDYTELIPDQTKKLQIIKCKNLNIPKLFERIKDVGIDQLHLDLQDESDFSGENVKKLIFDSGLESLYLISENKIYYPSNSNKTKVEIKNNRLKTLFISNLVFSDYYTYLNRLPLLETLHLPKCTLVKGSALDIIGKTVKDLSLTESNVSDDFFGCLLFLKGENLLNLEKIDVSFTNITTKSVERMNKLTQNK
jgi:hypothetical protein